MNKIWIIIRREYFSRVKARAFILTTLLAPLGFLGIMSISFISAALTKEEPYTVRVSDPTGRIYTHLKGDELLTFEPIAAGANIDTLKAQLDNKARIGILQLPSDFARASAATLFAKKTPALSLERRIENRVKDALRAARLVNAGLPDNQLRQLDVSMDLSVRKLGEKGDESRGSAGLAYALGFGMAMLIYFMMAIYGNLVMQAVMEEKTSRIMEVIISSVRPVQLMIGKITAIGLVGLTQILIWGVLLTALSIGFFALLPAFGIQLPQGNPQELTAEQQTFAVEFALAIQAFNPWLLVAFVLYFLGGFLIFGALYAAVGSAGDSPQDVQQLAIIPLLPLIVPILMISAILLNPTGSLAWWMSMIPFFSPTVMMVRLAATEVPLWEVALSLVLLVGGVAALGWVAGRIYRVGVLMYGKKVTPAELFRWAIART